MRRTTTRFFRSHRLLSIAVAAASLHLLPPGISLGADSVTGEVKSVTLYRGQAQVTREILVDGPAGSSELIVDAIPEQVEPSSLFGEGGEQVEVRAVRFRSRAVGAEPREEVRAAEDRIADIEHKISLNGKQQELTVKQSAYLDSLEGFVAPTAKAELTQGVLDAETLQKVTEFSFQQRAKLAEQEVELAREAKLLQEELKTAQLQLAEITQGASRSVREAVMFVEKHAAGPQTVRLTYLVNGCGWTPSYTIRATTGEAPMVRLEYNALIQQITGEDWKNVALTLSTASPAISAAGPGLAPFRVALSSAVQQDKAEAMQQATQLDSQLRSIATRQQRAVFQNRNTYNFRDNIDSAWTINGTAIELQCLELTADASSLSNIRRDNELGAEGPSLSYPLAGAVSLASRNDQQIVRIVQSDVPADFYYVATPVLTSYVYREAELQNSSRHDLLGGAVNVYLDGRFVGRTELPTVTRGQTFVVGLGADPQLRARRELAKKTDDVRGGNRELGFEYRLVIENYKDQAAKVRLLDRLPAAESSGDIQVSLGEGAAKLSNDSLYQRLERPKGLLRWDVDVAPGMTGEKSQVVNYQYTVEYDRQYQLARADQPAEQQQQEFEQLLRSKLKR